MRSCARSIRWPVVGLLTVVLIAGCSHPGRSREPTGQARERCLEIARKLGQALLAQDFTAAYAMTSEKYQKRIPLAQMQAQYEEAARPRGRPTQFSAEIGLLPHRKDGQEVTNYGIRPDIAPSTWRAWTIVTFKGENGTFDAGLLLVDEGGEIKAASVSFGMVPGRKAMAE